MHIVYLADTGALAVVTPTAEANIDEVIANDVPADSPYMLVESLPPDRTQRRAWSINWALPTGSITSIVIDPAKL